MLNTLLQREPRLRFAGLLPPLSYTPQCLLLTQRTNLLLYLPLGFSDILVLSLKDVLSRTVTVSTKFSAVYSVNYNVIVFGM